MNASNAWTTKSTIDCTRRFEEYKATVSRLFPALPSSYVDSRSISEVDALALGHFLECYPRRVVILDIGTFVGVSAFHFANHPKVLRVIGVDSNPTICDEIGNNPGTFGSSIDPDSLQDVRVLDVAQAALAKFGDELQKVQLRTGIVGNSQVATQGDSLGGLDKVEIPVLEPSDGVSLVAFVAGLRSKKEVEAGLEAIFAKDPNAIVILDDCRGLWGPLVQAGVVSFMENVQEKYHFQLFGDLGPSIATSDLGVIFPDAGAAETKQTLAEFSELFSEHLDPLRLLRREEELINAVNWYKNEADAYKNEADKWRRRNRQLATQRSNQRKRAGNSSDGILKLPSIRTLVRDGLLQKLLLRRPRGTPRP